jgi:hypothetical protein
MPDDVKGNDELVEIARRYFARLAAGPVPRGLEAGAAFSAPPKRWSRPRWAVSTPLVFVAVATVLFLVIVSAGHVLTTRRNASVTPPPTASVVRPTATPPPGGPVPSVLNGAWVQTNPPLSQPPTLTFYGGNKFELQVSSRGFGGGVSFGSAVVNGSELDLFNGDTCGIPLPGGVGRYQWTLHSGVLHLTRLNEDPCSMRGLIVANQSYTRLNG